jgi:hypothetical protein
VSVIACAACGTCISWWASCSMLLLDAALPQLCASMSHLSHLVSGLCSSSGQCSCCCRVCIPHTARVQECTRPLA